MEDVSKVVWREDNDPHPLSDNVKWALGMVADLHDADEENEKLREALYELIASATPLTVGDDWRVIELRLSIQKAQQLLKEREVNATHTLE